MPRVSILLPCYDAVATLPETIASIEQQTFADFEVIAVDDGSADGTLSCLEAWCARDPRVTVLTQQHGGITAALQHAQRHATGAVIARMDADDVAHRTRLERQVELLSRQPELAGCGTGIRYFPREIVRAGALRYEAWLNGIRSSDDIARELFVECPIAHPTLCVRAAAFQQVGGYIDRGWPEDYDLVLRLHEAGYRLANVGEVLLDWREQPSRASRVETRYQPAAFRRCKVHYLRRTLLQQRPAVVVWGAGPVGKAFARELLAQGSMLRAFVDLDPRKIGQVIHGAAVIPPDRIGEHRDALAVAAVGQPHARAEIRAALGRAGWREGIDFVAVA